MQKHMIIQTTPTDSRVSWQIVCRLWVVSSGLLGHNKIVPKFPKFCQLFNYDHLPCAAFQLHPTLDPQCIPFSTLQSRD